MRFGWWEGESWISYVVLLLSCLLYCPFPLKNSDNISRFQNLRDDRILDVPLIGGAKLLYCYTFCWLVRRLNLWLYCKNLQIKNLSKEEFVHILRRQSTGFSRGSSRFRGVTLHKCGRWEARMGQFLGKKWVNFSLSSKLFLGVFEYVSENVRKIDLEAYSSQF